MLPLRRGAVGLGVRGATTMTRTWLVFVVVCFTAATWSRGPGGWPEPWLSQTTTWLLAVLTSDPVTHGLFGVASFKSAIATVLPCVLEVWIVISTLAI